MSKVFVILLCKWHRQISNLFRCGDTAFIYLVAIIRGRLPSLKADQLADPPNRKGIHKSRCMVQSTIRTT